MQYVKELWTDDGQTFNHGLGVCSQACSLVPKWNVTCFVVKYVPNSFEVDYVDEKEDHLKTDR